MNEYEVLKRAVEKVLKVYSKEISVSVTFEKELGADSIDIAQILKCAEEELGVTTDISGVDGIITVGDALKVLREAMMREGKDE
ncbi:MAG: acyl carrier protein [Lachnospiraceae bacterium]|jgi:acyl carrier protein|nr:acyl carrier protein [Lachnospiraceae bacterium]MCR5389804.1 acyl carrier protein [Lachnospiraceae bacterium]